MPFVQTDEIQIYYEQVGSGPHCLMLNGSGGDLRYTPGFMQSPPAHAFTLTGYDQRGLGRTSKPDQPYTMADYAKDAAALIEALDIGPCLVWGVSFGGMVAQELAIRYPQYVRKLALFCTSPGGRGGASYPLHELMDLPDEERIRKTIMIGDNRINDEWIASHQDYFDRLVKAYDRDRYADEKNYAIGKRNQLRARADHDTWDRLARITAPVFLAGGFFDGIAKPESMRAMQKQIGSAQLSFYKGGHLFMFEDPRAYKDLIAFFEAP
jgi:3-oxoadipate enol-lactonase